MAQYCRYTGEIKTGKNVKQMVNRALQFATSDPKGPVYLFGAREPMEEEIPEYQLVQQNWSPVSPAALPSDAVAAIASALAHASEPLIVTGYSGRNHACPPALAALANTIRGLRVLDTGGSDMCFPANHRGWLGTRYGVDASIKTADVILVLDCDVPWITVHNTPREDAKVFHIDVDPLKMQMPVFWIAAQGRWKADAYTAVSQLNEYIQSNAALQKALSSYDDRWTALGKSYEQRLAAISKQAEPAANGNYDASCLTAAVRRAVPQDTIFAIEAVTCTAQVADQLQASVPGSYINCGGGGLGWSGGAALGIKLASIATHGGSGKFVCVIVGDGTYLFSVPGSVFWIAARYRIPVLTIILNNKGWNAPRKSLELVHPKGLGSKATNEEINISFAPTPDYAGIAFAATGGHCYAARVSDAGELDKVLGEAVDAVLQGKSAVVDAQMGGSEGKFGDRSKAEKELLGKVGEEVMNKAEYQTTGHEGDGANGQMDKAAASSG